MMPRTLFKSLAALAVLTTASLTATVPAAANNAEPDRPLINEAAPEMIRELARGYGTAQATKDNVGDPMIKGKANSLAYSIFFYDCQKGANCTSVQFQAAFDIGKKVKIEIINDWNIKKRFAKAERNDKGNGVLRMDYSLNGGATREHIDNAMDMWFMQLKDFAAHIGFRE